MTPSTLTAIRSILGSHFSEARAKALYRVVLEEELAASRDHARTPCGVGPSDLTDQREVF